MKVIKVDTDRILEYGKNIKNQRTNIKTEYNEVLAVRSQLDWDIASENGISTRLNKVIHSIEDINSKILELSSFFELAADKYDDAEKKIVKKANNIMKDHPAGILDILKSIIPWDVLKDMGLDAFDYFSDPGRLSVISLGVSSYYKVKIDKNFTYKIIVKDGKTSIKLITNESNYHKLQNLIREQIGPELAQKKGKYFERFKENGIDIYNENVKDGGFKENRSYFRNTKFEDLKDYINKIEYSPFKKLVSTSGSTFVSSLNVVDDFRGWKDASKYTKSGKSLGVLGNVIMLGNNGVIAAQEETGAVDIGRRFVVDSAIDLGTGAAAMATGAAFGSLIAPPIGTVVGVGIGFGINYIINDPIGNPPKSIVGHTKDFVNKKADAVVDTVADAAHAISKGIGKIFW